MPPSLTPSIITAWLACPHSLTLHRLEHEKKIEKADEPRSAFSRLVRNKGEHHERECLEALRARFGTSAIFEPPLLNKSAESFEVYLGRVTLPDLQAFKGLYQIPLAHDGMQGIADFLITVDDAGQPLETFMPIDAKLARKEAKPGHVLQLCFYADAVEAITGKRPEGVRIWLGKGGADAMEEIRLDEIEGYWRQVRADLASLLEATAPEETRPEPCDHCAFCKYQGRCEGEWREEDSLHFVASLTRRDREKLSAAGIASRGALASSTGEVKRFDAARLARLRLQARLQVEARPDSCVEVAVSTDTPVHVLPVTEGEGALRGFPQLPPEDAGDVYVDYEGHPFFTVQEGLIFLIGLLYRNDAGDWVYEPRWAHSKADEVEQMRRLAVWFEHRRAQHPDMHVYHYNHTERSTITSILDASDAPDAVVETLKTLLSEGIFVDLYTVVRQSLVVGVESYGLKTIERVAGYDRAGALQFAVLPLPQGDEADEALARGSDAVLKYEKYAHGTHLTEAQRDALLASIAHYNLRDLEALVVVVGWLRALCPEEVQWVRPTPPGESENVPLEVVARLQETDGTQGEHLMAEVLSYYKREKSAHDMQIRVTLDGHEDDLRDDEEALVGLKWVEGALESQDNGKRLIEAHIGHQAIKDDVWKESVTVKYSGGEQFPCKLTLKNVDRERRVVRTEWPGDRPASAAPEVVVLDGYRFAKPKPESLQEQAQKRLDTGSFSPLAGNLLMRTAAPAPSGGHAAQPDAIASHILQLDEGAVVPIQGPPGTGKTWMGAELALRLINAGKTIGIVAMSHDAAKNLAFTHRDSRDEPRRFEKSRDHTSSTGNQSGRGRQSSHGPQVQR
ncbi:MAG: TM0106 family RecB-like putative nuclease [Proteobacteria bacterium]|nr:TM0106 family RecB-like putative nuclease [Pseudomonadota bacterium]